jgi:predicted component of type VI protein secretion system
MLEPVSVLLKFGFLAVLYLFLLWVARSALKDLRRTERPAAAAPDLPADATAFHAAADAFVGGAEGEPRLVVDRAPGHEPGMSYDLAGGATLGRGDVEIQLEDPFASAHHARIAHEGPVVVLEDLGSTNGTYLNGEPLRGPQPLHPGDRIRIGDSEFTFDS